MARWHRAALLGLVGASCAADGAVRDPDRPAHEGGATQRLDPRELGMAPELLSENVRRQVERALVDEGLLSSIPLPGELRRALVAFQEGRDLAPTGRVDAATVEALGLEVDAILPLVAGAGAYWTAGATAGGGPVGGEPGPASMPPDAAELGAEEVASVDPRFHFEEARRLRAASQVLRGRAERAEDRATARALEMQAEKAEAVARLHAERLAELGGEEALAGWQPLPPGAEPEPFGLGEGEEVRAALPAVADSVRLSAEEVALLQRRLWTEGFLHRPPTVRLDGPTRQAIRAWQTARGFAPTGALDERTVEGLLGEDAREPKRGARQEDGPQRRGRR